MDQIQTTFAGKKRAFKERIDACDQFMRLCDEIRLLEFKLQTEYEIELDRLKKQRNELKHDLEQLEQAIERKMIPVQKRITSINRDLTIFYQKLDQFMTQAKLHPSTVALEKKELEIAMDQWLRSRDVYWCSPEGVIPDAVGVRYDERKFYKVFERDIDLAETSIEIVSAFATARRGNRIIAKLQSACRRGVEVTIFIQPPPESDGPGEWYGRREVIAFAEARNITVVQLSDIHQKAAIIDGYLCWEGSLNILSHKDKKESMRRFAGEAAAAQFRADLRLPPTAALERAEDMVRGALHT